MPPVLSTGRCLREVAVAEHRPFVSVVIPMRNEHDWIERCVASVLAQDYPADRMEVIVVDGDSDDGSLAVVDALAQRDPRVRLLRNPARIVPSSMNVALRAARGAIIARVDAHTMLERDYLTRGVELLESSGAWNVGGPMVKLGGGKTGNAIALAMSSRFGIGAYFHFADCVRACDTVYMGMWPRWVFEQVGLFDEELVRNQDDEHSYRIRKAGGSILVTPAMRSRYQNRQSWKALRKQFYQYGLWKVRVFQKHPKQMSVRHFVPPAFVAAWMTGVALAPFSAAAGLAAAGMWAIYIGILGVVAVRETRANPDFATNPVRVLLALVILHQAWGTGFLIGMVRFAPRWLRAEGEPNKLGAEGDTAPSSKEISWASRL